MAHEFAFLGASTIINFVIVIFFGIGLHFAHLCIDFESNGASNVALPNFVLKDKSVTCLKLFISAYRQVHVEGVGLLAFSSLVGLFLHLNTMVIHIHINHRSAFRGWIFGMAFFVSVGVSMLAVKIPQDYAWWHSIAVEAILVFLICFEALLLVVSKKIKEHGGNQNFLRDFLVLLAETINNVSPVANYLIVTTTHSAWDVQKILHLVGACLAVLIVLGQIIWLVYKQCAHQGKKDTGAVMDGGDFQQQGVQEDPAELAVAEEGGSKTSAVSTGEAEVSAGAAMDGDDVEKQMVRASAEVAEEGGTNTPSGFSNEAEVSAGAAMDGDDVEKQIVRASAEVAEEGGTNTPSGFSNEAEVSAGAAMDGDDVEKQMVRASAEVAEEGGCKTSAVSTGEAEVSAGDADGAGRG